MLNRRERLRLLLGTARHVKPAQAWARARRHALRAAWRVLGAPSLVMPAPCRVRLPLYEGLTAAAALPGAEAFFARAEDAAALRFTFLNHQISYRGEPDWHGGSHARLWRFHLHYFDYAEDLLVWGAGGRRKEACAAFRKLALSWIENNPPVEGDGWHPYTISLRLVNWLAALDAFGPELENDSAFGAAVASSLAQQAGVLAAGLELDVRGNHLVANLRALLALDLAMPGAVPAKLANKLLETLEAEVREQVLADGGHFERAPGYHAVVLRHLLEIAVLRLRIRGERLTWLDGALAAMLEHLRSIVQPDGRLPLLKDTAWDQRPDPTGLLLAGALHLGRPELAIAGPAWLYPVLLFGPAGAEPPPPRPSCRLKESGYFVLRDDGAGDQMIFDAGKPCPDYLPAHAHADSLSFELVVANRRVIVDSGVYEYEAGPWRDFFRSTRAHNTVVVGGGNQSEVWGSFRVARRARPGEAGWLRRPGLILAYGEHDGYRRGRNPVVHRRVVVWWQGRLWAVLDRLLGAGNAECDSCVHFHPAIRPAAEAEDVWKLEGADPARLWLTAFGFRGRSITRGREDHPIQGWYSESFGEKICNDVLVLNRSGPLPALFGYAVAKGAPARIAATGARPDGDVEIRCGEEALGIRLSAKGPPEVL